MPPIITNLKIAVINLICNHQSKTKYPEDLKNEINDLIQNPRKLKVVVIDDNGFPFEDALESLDCHVKIYKKYTKDISQPNQKFKPISIGQPDIIFCDINGIGEEIYKDYQGLGVIEHLREKYPFTAIYAYTGTPELIANKLKDQSTIDGIFAKEWSIDDFLVNFKKVRTIFFDPANRWNFLRDRFKHLKTTDRKLDELRISYVKKILFSKYYKKSLHMDQSQIKEIITENSNNHIDIVYLSKLGISTGSQIFSLFFPLLSE